jgi:hypothetical protein
MNLFELIAKELNLLCNLCLISANEFMRAVHTLVLPGRISSSVKILPKHMVLAF